MTTVVAVTTRVRPRFSFLQRLSLWFRRPKPKVEEKIAAMPDKAPEVIHNLKYSHSVSFDYSQLGGQS